MRIKIKSKIRNPLDQAGFTMVEIAISLGVIAFALVAIIGVLPMGMGVQRENREDTLVNQDGQYLLEVIRSAQGVDNLTNFVEFITIETTDGSGNTTVERYYDSLAFPGVPARPLPPGGIDRDIIRNGRDIVGLLTTPKYLPGLTNKVTASIHSLNGTAVEQTVATRELSYGYQLTTEVVPYAFFAAETTAHDNTANPDPQNLARSNRFHEAEAINKGQAMGNANANLFDVRVSLRWPLKPDGTGGPRRQQFRAMVGAHLVNESPSQFPAPPLWFFKLQQYQKR